MSPSSKPSGKSARGMQASQHQVNEAADALRELDRRKQEALNLYRPLPFQESFHACKAKQCVVLKGNQVGGSLAGFVEVARAATGRDPHGKYPKEGGTAVCLGYGEKHIGRVIHKYLFRAGAFRMIRDERTREWRTYRPWEPGEYRMGLPGDLHRQDDAKLSAPLIPNRYIKTISWDKRSDYIFSRVELTNGWQILAFNTAGEAAQAQGFQAHLIHIDEDTASPGWLNEMLQRTVHTKGLLRWTALPHMKNDEMVGIIEQAEIQAGEPDPTAVMIRATAYDNEYFPKDELKKSEQILKSQGEDVYRRRMLGEIVLDSILMYPTFNKRIHGAIRKEQPKTRVQEILEENQGVPPRDWCRYMIIDPGHTVCAVNFFAVPPPAIGDQVVAYDELYLRNCEETALAREVKKKVNDFCFQEFIIDMHGGRLREIGSGELPMFRYARKFEELGIKSQGTGYGFRAGSDDVVKRVGELRSWLHIRGDGTTKLLIVTDRCTNTVAEFGRYRKKMVKVNGLDTPLDEGERRNIHAIDNLEYGAAHGLRYVKPPVASTAMSKAAMIYRDTMARRALVRAESSDGGISLGVD